jgi:hypothetical protein
MVRAQEALGGLRGVASVASLAERAPVAASRIGFSRILFSRIRDGTWFPCSASAGEDERRKVPILVRNPQSNPRVHPNWSR